jgi:cysteinyl-tRNA synthetase
MLSFLISRSYVCVDILQRILRGYFGYDVFHVMGMTDIDDKIIVKASITGTSIENVSRKYEQEFLQDMEQLGVIPHYKRGFRN